MKASSSLSSPPPKLTLSVATTKRKQHAQTLAAAFAVILTLTSSFQAAEPAKFPITGHLKDPSIIRGEDGSYYLTGTSNINSLDSNFSDFQNNDGIRLWKSRDLDSWEEVGLVWNLANDASPDFKESTSQRIVRPDRSQFLDESWHHGVTDVSLSRVGEIWSLTFSMNHYGIIILTSKAVEGPYKIAMIASKSLFPGRGRVVFDAEGVPHLLWGQGNIARLNAGLTGLIGDVEALRIDYGNGLVDGLPTGAENALVFHHDGLYHLLYSGWSVVNGRGQKNVLAASASVLTGPYSAPVEVMPEDGRPEIVRTNDGGFMLATSVGHGLKLTSLSLSDNTILKSERK